MKNRPRKRPPVSALIEKINRLDGTARVNFAKQCGTSVGNLRQIAYGFGGVSPKLAKNIVEHSDCNLSIGELIPELS